MDDQIFPVHARSTYSSGSEPFPSNCNLNYPQEARGLETTNAHSYVNNGRWHRNQETFRVSTYHLHSTERDGESVCQQ